MLLGSSATDTSIGTVSGGEFGSDLVITLTSDATTTATTALFSTIGYENSSDTPDTTDRTATFTLDDGDGGDKLGCCCGHHYGY